MLTKTRMEHGMHIVFVFNRLNEKGQSIAVERIEELEKIPDYQKTKGE